MQPLGEGFAIQLGVRTDLTFRESREDLRLLRWEMMERKRMVEVGGCGGGEKDAVGRKKGGSHSLCFVRGICDCASWRPTQASTEQQGLT